MTDLTMETASISMQIRRRDKPGGPTENERAVNLAFFA
jgi:hypothetical protein